MADSRTDSAFTPLPRKTIFFYGLTQVPLAMLFVVSFTFAVVPAIFFLLAVLIVWRYPVTEVRHSKIREVLESRRARAESPGIAE